MQRIIDKKFPNERDLYASRDIELINCVFDGIEDGESALKESKNVKLRDCYMNLRYPLWHDDIVELHNVLMTDKCRAALWYTNHVNIQASKFYGIKAVRECNDITIEDSEVASVEFGWKSHNIKIKNTSIEGEYVFLLSSDIKLSRVKFKGKYSFQYVENLVIEDSFLETKDAFWHSKNVVVQNSVIKGEYLGWYSENLTFINCKIIGTQPLCYCKGLKLIDCTMIDADLSFEYSDVDAKLHGEIVSIKNPKSGKIIVDKVAELILTQDSVYPSNCKIILTKE